MSTFKKNAERASYTLRQRDTEPQVFTTLRELYWALRELQPARDYFERHVGGDRDILDLDVRVFDADGRRRADLENPLHPIYQAWPRVDHLWSGDIRPRGAPIPGTGRWIRRHYFRRMKTQQERRMGQPFADEGEPSIRGKRRPHLIPTQWWDVPQRDAQDRNWKKFRKHQWR